MVKNAKTLGAAGLVVVIGVVLVVVGQTIPGAIVALLGVAGLVYLFRLPSEVDEDDFLESPEPTRRPSRSAERSDSLSTWEPEGSLATWEPEDTGGGSSWEAEDSGASLSWETEDVGESLSWDAEPESAGESLTWEAEPAGENLTWEAEPAGESLTWEAEEHEESFDTFESLSFEDEGATPASSSSSLFSVASPIDENVATDDDIMAASHATELTLESSDGAAAGADNSELAKLLAKVQSRLAAYE